MSGICPGICCSNPDIDKKVIPPEPMSGYSQLGWKVSYIHSSVLGSSVYPQVAGVIQVTAK